MRYPSRVWVYREGSHYLKVSTSKPLGLIVEIAEYILRRNDNGRSDRLIELEDLVSRLRDGLNSAAFALESEAPYIGRYNQVVKNSLENEARRIRELLSESEASK